ncbi:hypothetical protein P8452_47553 [Trifolium repens]|nr:hypothetical protein P8452_47553 [Trifolium repens]
MCSAVGETINDSRTNGPSQEQEQMDQKKETSNLELVENKISLHFLSLHFPPFSRENLTRFSILATFDVLLI